MNAQEFVDAIQKLVQEAAVGDTLELIQCPPGRRPAVEIVELSAWYNQLPDSDRAMVQRVLALVARNTVFGLFAVLDGARKIDPAGTAKSYFELRYIHEGRVEVLSGRHGSPLHELL